MDRNLKIGVVGLGLIGGSIFKALCALKCNVFGVTHSSATLKKAQTYSDNVSLSFSPLKNCDVVFVCVPMNKVNEHLDKLEEYVSASTIVSDVSSLKRFVTVKPRPYVFIPSHPMAGTEFSGFDNAFESLFQGAKWVITPNPKTEEKSIRTLSDIIEVLGANVIKMTPKDHDECVALISHMPMLVSQALFKTVMDNSPALKLASSGFRDMTRLALSNEEMANDMINLNSDNIESSLLKLYSALGELLNNNYSDQITKIKAQRTCMYANGKNVL